MSVSALALHLEENHPALPEIAYALLALQITVNRRESAPLNRLEVALPSASFDGLLDDLATGIKWAPVAITATGDFSWNAIKIRRA